MDIVQERILLKSACDKCSGLCCVCLYFSKIGGFPEDKKAGKPCRFLTKDYRCQVHEQLEKLSFKGCIGYDCFGAGQHVVQVLYHGQTYHDRPKQANEIFDVFNIVFKLFQIRYFLIEALSLNDLQKNKETIIRLIIENKNICNYDPQTLLSFDLKEYQKRINPLLKQVCKQQSNNVDTYALNFLAKNFQNKDMSRLDLSMKLLITANFKGCNFAGTIFLGADTRDADFSNADLENARFLTQGQINVAKGNRFTKLPAHLEYPVTWK